MASSRAFLPALLVLLAATTAATAAAHARPTTTTSTAVPVVLAAPAGLAERLDREGPQQYCWEALMEIKSCTGEIILFFLNGEAYMGPGCCRAIRVVEQRCWAADAMLSVIGLTPEEGNMLKGYCDAGEDDNGGHHQHGGGSQPAPAPHRALDGVATGSTAAAAAAGRKGLGAPLDG